LADLEGLLDRYDTLAKEIQRVARQGKKILVVTHIDADGIASGSLVFASLMRRGANVTLRSIPDLDLKFIAQLKEGRFDYHIFTDLASSLLSDLSEALDGRYLVIDHHQLTDEDLSHPNVVNAWQFGFDGGTEACSSTMAYFFARAVDYRNADLAYLPIVGAVADRQDSGPGRSLTGLNRKALEDAQSAGLVSATKDLLFTGRETRPIHEAIALTSTPYLPGLSGSKDAVLAALLQAGFELRSEGAWRTLSELSSEEKMKLTEVIAGVLLPSGGGTDQLTGLIGEVYTLELEDPFTPLRDAREFGTLLNACGRMDQAGVGMAVCLGDRADSLKAAMKTLLDYRSGLAKAMDALMADRSRIEVHGKTTLVRGDDTVAERLLGPVASILTSSPGYKDKVVVARTKAGQAELKISGRVGDSFEGKVNLGSIIRESAEAVGGVGGGHSMAAGAKIPAAEGERFERLVLEKLMI
jgi:single-stranded-DNA-specific exonuclease